MPRVNSDVVLAVPPGCPAVETWPLCQTLTAPPDVGLVQVIPLLDVAFIRDDKGTFSTLAVTVGLVAVAGTMDALVQGGDQATMKVRPEFWVRSSYCPECHLFSTPFSERTRQKQNFVCRFKNQNQKRANWRCCFA